MKTIDSFDEHRKKRQEKRRRMQKRLRQVHQLAQDALRDWQTDAYRGQSGRREADVVQ